MGRVRRDAGSSVQVPSFYRATADVVVVLHIGFVLFVVLGGLLAFKWRWLWRIHAPAAIWGVAIELGGWICPLTPLENHLRRLGGASGYEMDFVEHYVLPLLYPVELTRGWQVALGCFALAANALIYYRLLIQRRSSRA
jgi:Protein of Unknown function (DUF2784)